MYKKEFDTLLKSKKIPKTLLVCGDCDYQLQFLENQILDFWGNDGVLKIYFDEYDFKAAKTHLSQASLFSGKNILLLKFEKNPPTKEIKELLELCRKNDANHLLCIHFGYSKDLANLFGTSFVRVFKAKMWEATNFLIYEAGKKNLQIENDILQKLFLAHNEDLALAVSELGKLAILNRKITVADINNLVVGMGEIDIEDFIVKLLNGEKIATIYESFYQGGGALEVTFINAIKSYIFTLFLFHSFIKINGKCDSEKILGRKLPPQRVTERENLCKKFNAKTFNALLKILNNAEYELKAGSAKIESNKDSESILIAALLELQSEIRSENERAT